MIIIIFIIRGWILKTEYLWVVKDNNVDSGVCPLFTVCDMYILYISYIFINETVLPIFGVSTETNTDIYTHRHTVGWWWLQEGARGKWLSEREGESGCHDHDWFVLNNTLNVYNKYIRLDLIRSRLVVVDAIEYMQTVRCRWPWWWWCWWSSPPS